MPATERGWTRAEVLDLIDRNPGTTPRYELVDGALLVTPAPTTAHQRAVGRIFWLLAAYLDGQRQAGEAFTSPADVMLEPNTTVSPDVFVVPPHESMRLTVEGWPARDVLLAVEVLSPGDRSGDRTRKRVLYQRRIPEYWIVDTDGRRIEVWRTGATAPEIAAASLTWRPPRASAPFTLDVTRYFARVHHDPA